MADPQVLLGIAIEVPAPYNQDVARRPVDLLALLPQQLAAAKRNHPISPMTIELASEMPYAHHAIAVEDIEHVDCRIDIARTAKRRFDIEKRDGIKGAPFLGQFVE